MTDSLDRWGMPLAMSGIAMLSLVAFVAGAAAHGRPDSLWGMTCANTALAGSALLYLSYQWCRTENVGRAASAFAGGGAMGVIAIVGVSALRGHGSDPGLLEGTALLSAGAVIAYLAMERVYRNRSAGIVVMMAVMVAVLCEMWLITKGLAAGGRPAGGLGSYWNVGHRFAFCLAYLPLAIAALLATQAFPGRRPAPPRFREAMHASFSVGALLLALGASMGAVWSMLDPREIPQAAPEVALPWLVAGLAAAAWSRVRRADDPRLPRYGMVIFALATATLFISRPLAVVTG